MHRQPHQSRRCRRALMLVSLAALVALSVVVPNAQAIVQNDYAVTIEGSGSYSIRNEYPANHGTSSTEDNASFAFKSTLQKATFIDDLMVIAPGSTAEATVKSATREIVNVNGDGTVDRGTCTGATTQLPPDLPQLGPSLRSAPGGETGIDVRTLGSLYVDLTSCTGGYQHELHAIHIASGVKALGSEPFDTFLTMPHEAIGMGRIIQLVDRQLTGSDCPNRTAHTVSCNLTWKATITFDRTGQIDHGPDNGDLEIPMPQPAPPSSPPVEPDDLEFPMPGDDELVIPMPKPKGKLGRGAKQASLTVTCPTGCSGRALAYPMSRGGRAAAARPLARASFTVAPRAAKTVTLRFSRRARKQIKRARGVRIALRVSPKGGRAISRSIPLRLRR